MGMVPRGPVSEGRAAEASFVPGEALLPAGQLARHVLVAERHTKLVLCDAIRETVRWHVWARHDLAESAVAGIGTIPPRQDGRHDFHVSVRFICFGYY